MKPDNAEFVQKIVEITRDPRFSSEGECGFEPFIWEIAERGNLTLEKLLQSEGFLFAVELNDFLEFVSSETNWSRYGRLTPIENASLMGVKYKQIIDFLNSYLKNLELYIVSNLGYGNSDIRKRNFQISRLGNPALYSLSVNHIDDLYKRGDICVEQEAFHIFLGETIDGEWLGITPKMAGGRRKRGGDRFVLTEASVNKNTVALKRHFEELTRELEFSVVECSAFYTKERAIVEVASFKDELLYRLLGTVEFFRAYTFDEYSSGEYQDSEKFHCLDEILKSNLTSLRDYIIGLNAKFFIYSIGRTMEGDWLGVSTSATWT